MPYVPDKLVSPLSTPPVAYITNTDESWRPEGRGKYSAANLQEIWNRVKIDLHNARRLGRAHRHSVHNAFCSEEIKRGADLLKSEHKNVFITSLSADFTPIDERLKFYPAHPTGWDPFCNLAKVNEEIGDAIQKYSVKFKEKYHQKPKLKHVFWPICPYLFGYCFEERGDKMVVNHIFPETINRTNGLMTEHGYRCYGSAEKEVGSNEPQLGNFEWSELLVSPEAAKRSKIGIIPGRGYDLRFVYNSIPYILDADAREKLKVYKAQHKIEPGVANILDINFAKKLNYDKVYDQVVDWSTFINRNIIANFLEDRILQPLQIKKIEIIAEKSGYVKDITNFYSSNYSLGWWDVMENAVMPRDGIANKSAINRIMGVVWSDWRSWL